MGITPLHASLIILEHKRRALPQTVHLLGRQTVYLIADQATALMRSHGVDPVAVPMELDEQTRGAAALQGQFISDRMFFAMLGVKETLAIDHADYEGAEIIIDLNVPLSSEHVGTVDFLFGGSVLDNIFDPCTYICNVSGLLKQGGRIFDQNLISQVHHPYILITPAWLIDYFVVNRFSNVAIYVAEQSSAGFTHLYGLVPSGDENVSDFGPPRGSLSIGIISIAEKGVHSTSDVLPNQDQYRSEAEWKHYRESAAEILRGFSLPAFAAPTASEMARLGVRVSKSFRYLGVLRHDGQQSESFDGTLPDPGAVGGLRIIEATYGGGCAKMAPRSSAVSALYQGNVTDVLSSLANGAERWEWTVDVRVLGDPVPGVGKDLEVLYYYRGDAPTDARVRRAYLEAEASGKTLVLARDA